MRPLALALLAAALTAPDGAPAGEPASGFTVEQARAVIEQHVERAVREGGGVYRLQDAGGKTHDLEFVHVGVVGASKLWSAHDPDRRGEAGAFVACASFHPVGAPKEKLYDVDLLVEPRDGRLDVTDVWIHMEKQLVRGEWVWREWPKNAGGAARR